MSFKGTLFLLSFSLLFCGSVLATEKGAFADFSDARVLGNLHKTFSQGLKSSEAQSGLFFVALNGRIVVGNVIDVSQKQSSENLLKKTYPLGESTLTFVSLLALSLEQNGLISLGADVDKYFSKFRCSNGTLQGVNIENLLSQKSGFAPLAEKIPTDSSCDEFFDILAQMNFSLPEVSYSPSLASPSVAAYALAYVCEPNSKDLKKSFVRAMRKFLFTPLKIESPKYRHFDKWYFPSVGLALNADAIKSWLECETSQNPPISNATKIALRRDGGKFQYSQGWKRRASSPCKSFETTSLGHSTLIYKVGADTLALAMFSDSKNLEQTSKLFERLANDIDDILKTQ